MVQLARSCKELMWGFTRKLMDSWCKPILIPLPTNRPTRAPSAWNYYISPRWAKLRGWRQADRQCYGRAKVALEADTHRKASFVTLVSKPHAIAKSVCVVGQGSWEGDARWFFFWRRGLKGPLKQHHRSPPHVCPWDLLFSFSLIDFLHLSLSLSRSLTTKCSPSGGTWWLWRVRMKTCQWRYEVLSSV